MAKTKKSSGGQSLLFDDVDMTVGVGAYSQRVEEQDLLPESFDDQTVEVSLGGTTIERPDFGPDENYGMNPDAFSPEETDGALPADFVAVVQPSREAVQPRKPASKAEPDDLPLTSLGKAYREIQARRSPESDQLDRAWTLNHAALAAMTRAIAFLEQEQPESARSVLEIACEDITGKRQVT